MSMGKVVSRQTFTEASRLRKPQIRLCRNDTKGVSMTFAATPALHTDNHVALGQDAEFE